MKIGIFDSGLGGLIITHSLTNKLPQYDYIYLGDTARIPYGNRSQQVIYDYTKSAVDYLFAQDCELIIIACNTASAEALRRIQQEHLPAHHPDKTVLGVLIPAAEAAVEATKSGLIGVLATTATISSQAFDRELTKLRSDVQLSSLAAPLLVPLVEAGEDRWAQPILHDYLETLSGIDTLILGCTHYPYFKSLIADEMGDDVAIISQDEILPAKLQDYLMRHSDLAGKLSQNRTRRFLLTDSTEQAEKLAARLYGQPIQIERIEL